MPVYKDEQRGTFFCSFYYTDWTEELCVGAHIVRYKTVKSNRFDTTAFKKEHANMYADFLKESTSRRFTIA